MLITGRSARKNNKNRSTLIREVQKRKRGEKKEKREYIHIIVITLNWKSK